MAETTLSRRMRREYQDFLRSRARQEPWTHFITLNFHKQWDSSEAKKALSKWAHSVCYHLFRRHAARPQAGERALYFFAFKEFTDSNDPHWHLLAQVNGSGATRLTSVGSSKWKSIVPSATSDIQVIGRTELDRQRLTAYVSKAADLEHALNDFCISTELGLPSYCGRTDAT